jgi:hypothetical protein
MSVTEFAGNAVKSVRLALKRAPTPDDISDEQFMNDLGKIKQLRSFLIEQAVQLQPTEAASISFGKLNLLRFNEDGRSPNEEEWDSLERLTQALFSHLNDALRRRFLYSRTPAWFTPLVLCLGVVAITSLVTCTFMWGWGVAYSAVIPFFIAWVGSLGAIGAVAFIGMNALSVQDDATFDFSNNRLLVLRIVLGGLFGIVLTLPFGFESFIEFIGSLVNGKGAASAGIGLQSTMLLLPFVLGFSTSLVIMILNQFVEAIQSFFGKKVSQPPAASPVVPVPAPQATIGPGT